VAVLRALALVDREGVDGLDVFETGDRQLEWQASHVGDPEGSDPDVAARHHDPHVAVGQSQ
jgi:hypothetical protein